MRANDAGMIGCVQVNSSSVKSVKTVVFAEIKQSVFTLSADERNEQGDSRQYNGIGSTEIDITSRRVIILTFISGTVK